MSSGLPVARALRRVAQVVNEEPEKQVGRLLLPGAAPSPALAG